MEHPKKIQKEVSKHLGRGQNAFLLGRQKGGERLWLLQASWDCNWYWGFGYIQQYPRDVSPARARDIVSHSHWDSRITGQHKRYNVEKSCFVLDSTYVHHLNEHPDISETTLSDSERWTLAELMKSFYTLKASADFFGKGSAYVTQNPLARTLKKPKLVEEINQKLLPGVFEEIYKLLTPEK